MIPPGTKGVIRGNKFNKLVEKKIKSFELNLEDFEIKCEKSHPDFETSEIPDWYIYQKSTNKITNELNNIKTKISATEARVSLNPDDLDLAGELNTLKLLQESKQKDK